MDGPAREEVCVRHGSVFRAPVRDHRTVAVGDGVGQVGVRLGDAALTEWSFIRCVTVTCWKDGRAGPLRAPEAQDVLQSSASYDIALLCRPGVKGRPLQTRASVLDVGAAALGKPGSSLTFPEDGLGSRWALPFPPRDEAVWPLCKATAGGRLYRVGLGGS